MQRHQAPFRADIVGSYLRPDAIKQARLQLAAGAIDAQQLRQIENEAIRDLVQQQCECGLHVVTDGEFRRAWWHFDFLTVYRALSATIQKKVSSSTGYRPKRTGFASPVNWPSAITRCWKIFAI